MLNKILEYLAQPDCGCYNIQAQGSCIELDSVYGHLIIEVVESEKATKIIYYGSSFLVNNILGERPDLMVVEEGEGEKTTLYYVKHGKVLSEHTDDIKAIAKAFEEIHVRNAVRHDYLAFIVGGEEILKLVGNKITPTDNVKYKINLSNFAGDLMEKWLKDEMPCYINSDGNICI